VQQKRHGSAVGRSWLEDVIPLATPLILFVDPASVCNFQCRFCPTGDRALIDATGRWQGLLHLDVFKKVIDDLAEFEQPLNTLRLYKEGEPLLNKALPEMIRYARASGRVEHIDTTTNGFLLTPQCSTRLIEAGIDAITISVDGLSDEMFYDVTQTRVSFAKFVENVRFLYENRGRCHVRIRMPRHVLSADEKERFYDVFRGIADTVELDNLTPCWPEFDMESRMRDFVPEGRFHQPYGEVDTCPYIFYSVSIASDGSVILCFIEWARKLVIGDVRKQSLKSIWDGDELFAHQLAHLRGQRNQNPVCAACGQLQHCSPDNLDPHREMLAERLVAGRTRKPSARRFLKVTA
jgi:radical SAM protein with 4Fe4S-binding SPASM domain